MEVSRDRLASAVRERAGVLLNDTAPVPRALLGRLWLALGVSGLFMVAAAVQGAMRPGYDPWHQAVSALSLGPGGWVQGINFILLGVVLLGTARTWRRILSGGRGAGAYPVLTAITGVSFVVVAFVPQDPAPGYDPMQLALTAPTAGGLLHLALAGVATGCSVAGLFVMAHRLSGDPHWIGWASYTRVMAVLLILSVAIYGVWSTRAAGFAGTFERLAILIPSVWGLTFVRRLWEGAPFMAPAGSRSIE